MVRNGPIFTAGGPFTPENSVGWGSKRVVLFLQRVDFIPPANDGFPFREDFLDGIKKRKGFLFKKKGGEMVHFPK